MRTMNYKKWKLILLCICISFLGCNDSDEQIPTVIPTITIDSDIIANGLLFSEQDGEKILSFESNVDWLLNIASTTSGQTWCIASVTSGSEGKSNVRFSVAKNEDFDDRSVSVTITAGSANTTFVITQKQKEAILVTADKYEVIQSGGAIQVEVKSNLDYQILIDEESESWITSATTRSLTTRQHIFNIAASEEYDKREGKIYFQSGDKMECINVYQAGGGILLLTKNVFLVGDSEEVITIEIQSNFNYSVEMPNVDWIVDEASSRGLSSHTLKYRIKSNDTYDARSAQIVFLDKNSDLKEMVTITQSQKDAIVLSQSNYDIMPNGGLLTIEVNSNVAYEMQMPSVDWLNERTVTRGLAQSHKHIMVSTNQGTDERSAEIRFTHGESGISEFVTIKQRAQTLTDYRVNVEIAGTISTLIPNNIKAEISKLTIEGFLNSDDIRFIREMGGRDVNGEEVAGKLSVLDLASSKIVSGGQSYYNEYWQSVIITNTTNDDVIGGYFFQDCNFLEIVLPNSITRISGWAFSGCENLSKVLLNDALGVIGHMAFGGCTQLKSISIPNSVKELGDVSFSNSGLLSIVIPESVTTFGTNIFYGCTQLSSVQLPQNMSTIPQGTFFNCNTLRSIDIPNSVTIIGQNAFGNCRNLRTTVVLPESLNRIDGYAFSGCYNLTEMTIPASVNSMGDMPFYECSSLKEIICKSYTPPTLRSLLHDNSNSLTVYVPQESLSAYKIADGWKYTNLVGSSLNKIVNINTAGTLSTYFTESSMYNILSLKIIGNLNGDDIAFLRKLTDSSTPTTSSFKLLKTLDLSNASIVKGGGAYYTNDNRSYYTDDNIFSSYLFHQCYFEEINLPESINKIESVALRNCSKLKELTIPSNVIEIGGNAFSGCTSLVELKINEGVKIIAGSAFWNCTLLRKITLPSTLIEIGGWGFYECYSLSDIHCNAITPPQITDNTFRGVNKETCTVHILESSKSNYDSTLYWKEFINIVIN